MNPESKIDRVIFIGIIFLLIFAPLAFGSVHVWAYSIIEVGVFVLVVLWFADRLIFSRAETLVWVKTPVNLILIMFLVLIGVQLIPFPDSMVELISPHTYADKKQLFTLLTQASDASSEGPWGMMLSYTSHATVVEWLKLAAYVGMFFLVLNTATSKQKIDILVYTIILVGLFQALYAIYQVFSISPKVWWWKSRVGGSRYASGTFIVSNHFAGYMEMVLCLAFGFLIAQKRKIRRLGSGLNGSRSFLKKCVIWFAPESARPKMIFFFFVTALIGVALLLSASRGGILSMGVTLLLMSVLFFSKQRHRIYGVLALCLCAAIFTYGLHVGIDPTIEKFENPNNRSGRFHVTRTILPMISDYPCLGVGLGNFRYVYPRYIDDYDRVRASGYAHNDWVEAGIETGFPGLVLILLGFGIYIARMIGVWRDRRDFHALGIGAGVVAGLLCIGMHSYFDFNMHIPANPLTLAAVLALGYAAVHRQGRVHGEFFLYPTREIPLTGLRRVTLLFLVMLISGVGVCWTGKHFLAEAACPTEWNSTMNLNYDPGLSNIERAISLNNGNYAYHNKRAVHFMSLTAKDTQEKKAHALETGKSLEQAVRRNPAMGVLWYNMGKTYASATLDMFDYLNRRLPLADHCFDTAVHCGPRNEYLLSNVARYWVWRAGMLPEKGKEGKKVRMLEGKKVGQKMNIEHPPATARHERAGRTSNIERRMKNNYEAMAGEQKSRRLEGKKVSQKMNIEHPPATARHERAGRTSNIELTEHRPSEIEKKKAFHGVKTSNVQRRMENNPKDPNDQNNPKDQNAAKGICREEGIRKFQGYYQRLLAMNPNHWKEAVEHTRVYFPDDGVVLGIVPEDNEVLKRRVLGFLAKTESSGSVKGLAKAAKRRYHTVGSGESLYSISRRYGVTVKKIQLLNKLDRGDVVYPGQKLWINNY